MPRALSLWPNYDCKCHSSCPVHRLTAVMKMLCKMCHLVRHWLDHWEWVGPVEVASAHRDSDSQSPHHGEAQEAWHKGGSVGVCNSNLGATHHRLVGVHQVGWLACGCPCN